MTDSTPIEKAAEDCAKHLLSREPNETYIKEIAEAFASIIRRRLGKEVPERSWEELSPQGQSMYSRGAVELYNQCRRAIGLRDEEETEA